jgi:diamine N-acetyltransferase
MIVIRPLLLHETTIVQAIAHNTWPKTFGQVIPLAQIDYMLELMYSEESLRNQIQNKQHKFLLAVQDGDPLGFISYELNYKSEVETMIHKLYLLPQSQGKGIGKALIDAVSDISKNNNCSGLRLKVFIHNPKAVGFYQKLGFMVVGTEQTDIGSGYVITDYVMAME